VIGKLEENARRPAVLVDLASAQIKAATVPDLYILRADEVSSQAHDLA